MVPYSGSKPIPPPSSPLPMHVLDEEGWRMGLYVVGLVGSEVGGHWWHLDLPSDRNQRGRGWM
ncbi:hypothetical protein EON63_23065 [archaeon]|nr:MAG: hypothetical protein EON63_23065 [archaeon]